jgi:hypothetical protein
MISHNLFRSAFLLIFSCLASTLSCTGQKAESKQDADTAQRMLAATKAHQYDEAVRIGSDALKANPSDALLLSQIGLVYMKRAEDDQAEREKWLSLATDYAEKTANAAKEDDLSYFTAARLYESAGDLSLSKRCTYYGSAINIFNHLASGRTNPSASEPIRRNAQHSLAQVTQRATAANCPVQASAKRP